MKINLTIFLKKYVNEVFRVRIFGGLWNSKEIKVISIFMRYILYDKGNTSMEEITGTELIMYNNTLLLYNN